MKKSAQILSTIILLLVLTFPETLRAEEVKSGEVLFNENCASCHDGSVPKAPHVISFNFSFESVDRIHSTITVFNFTLKEYTFNAHPFLTTFSFSNNFDV